MPFLIAVAYFAVFVKPHCHGDLGRVGLIPFDDSYDAEIERHALTSRHFTEINDASEIESPDSSILTIGDSFSLQGRFGYQNYLAKLFPRYRVYNLNRENTDDHFPYFEYLLASGSKLPAIVVLEIVERSSVDTIARMNLHDAAAAKRRLSATNAGRHTEKETPHSDWAKAPFCKIKNLIEDTHQYFKKRCGIENSVKHLKLNHEFFSCNGAEDDLFFYQDDITEPIPGDIPECQRKIYEIFHAMLRRGTKFVLLVAPDKYDMYKRYAVTDPYRVMGRLDYLTRYDSSPMFVNGRNVLLPHLSRGEKDIFRCNDTHWSPVAARYAAEAVAAKLRQQGVD